MKLKKQRLESNTKLGNAGTAVAGCRGAGLSVLQASLATFAQRLNYRNHRKIVVIDGCTAYVGGINISDRYINRPDMHGTHADSPERGSRPIGSRGKTPTNKDRQLFWRDTHLRINGTGCYFLQHLFFCDWNFCADQELPLDASFFCDSSSEFTTDGAIVQIGASGPNSRHPGLLFSFLQSLNSTEQEILITTPYFVPGDSLLDALVVAALSGVRVKLLVPDRSDSWLVDAAARSYYGI